VWGACILAAQFSEIAANDLSSSTLLILFGAWWCLLLGALCVLKRQPKHSWRLEPLNAHRAIVAVFALLTLQAAVVIWELPNLDSVLSATQLIVVLRVAGITLVNKCPWWLEIFRSAYFVYIPLIVLMRERRVASRRTLLAIVAASFVLSLCRMTRAPLLGTSVTLWASWVLIYRKPAARAWSAMGAIGGAIGLVFLLSQPVIDSAEGSSSETARLVEPYFGGSMHAFGNIVDGTFPRSPGLYSADMVYYVLNKLDFVPAESFPSIVRPYADNETNVYTFLDCFTLDGGIIGAFIGAFTIGLLGGIIFNKASTNPNLVFTTAYSSFCYYISMSILNNEFIRISVVITLIIAAVVALIVRRRSSHRYLVRAFADPPSRAEGFSLETAARR
jgi:oligosaccharide repeat unit polymerase